MKALGSKLTILMFVCAAIAVSSLAVRVNATVQINILTHSGWRDTAIGTYHISGEVENAGNTSAHAVRIRAIFYDLFNAEVDTKVSNTILNVILPCGKAAFEITLPPPKSSSVDHYSLSVESYSNADPLPQGLEIQSSSSNVDGAGTMHVTGTIKNTATETAVSVTLITTFYDSGGKVVATASARSNPTDVNAGQTGSFDVTLVYPNRVSSVSSYALTAESNQYAVTPEFPTSLMLALLAIATLLSVMVYKGRCSA